MAEFVKREVPLVGPTSCVFCGGFEGPFIDTAVDLLGHGRINICTKRDERGVGCAEQIGREGGHMVDDDIYGDALDVNAKQAVKLGELEAELEQERAVNAEAIVRAADIIATRLETAREVVSKKKTKT